jgi:hypothetical protein
LKKRRTGTWRPGGIRVKGVGLAQHAAAGPPIAAIEMHDGAVVRVHDQVMSNASK